MNLQIRSNVSYHGWSKGLYCVFADIRSRSTLLSCPLVNGRPNWASSIPLSWWYTWLHGTGSTFSGWALESFIPLSFERSQTILSSAPFLLSAPCAGWETGGGELFAYRISKYFPTWRRYPVDWHVFQRALRMKSLYSCSDGIWHFRSLYHIKWARIHKVALRLCGGHMSNCGRTIQSLGKWDGSVRRIHATRLLVHSHNTLPVSQFVIRCKIVSRFPHALHCAVSD